MTLTINKAYALDDNGKDASVDITMITGAGAKAGECKLSTAYWTKNANSDNWGSMKQEKVLTFQLTLQYVEFHKQMYSPNSIEAYILIKPKDSGSTVYKAFPSKDQLKDLFANKVVELKCDGNSVCDDYYVHEFFPRKYSDKMYVLLKIYSPDKMMTLKQYCRTFTAKRLGEEIINGENGEIGNFSITRDQKSFNTDGTVSSTKVTTALSCVTTNMKHLKSGGVEHIFPYLVQYNESFYDFLARTTNRWGEFLYYESGQLNIGYSDTSKDVKSYSVMSYLNWNDSRPEQANAGTYVGDAPYDSNILRSVVVKDGFDAVKNTMGQMFDFENGGDVFWMKKVASVFNNSKSITNFFFESAVDDLVAWASSSSRVALNNKKGNDAYFKDMKTDHGELPDHDDGAHEGTKSVKKLLRSVEKDSYNEFSEATPIVDEKTYADILEKEVTAGQNMVNIEFDTAYPNLLLGQVIAVDGENYIVTEVVGYQPEKIIIDQTEKKKAEARSYYEKAYDNDVVRYRVTAVAKDSGDDKYYPPVLPTGHVRTSGPQVAVVVDVDDPLRANRVRVKYPWQLTDFIDKEDEDRDDDKKIKTFEKLKAKDLKEIDVEDATPWLLYASSSGPVKAGVHGRHYLAEKVLVDYAGGNVERPYVVGAVSPDVPPAIKTGSSVMMAPNGEFVKVHEGMGNGAAAFIANLNPGLKLFNSFVPIPSLFDNEATKRFEGGVEMGDKYGIWSIKASTDARNVSISSPWGDVKIDAFTGITISAPNGDVKITGKNVTIAAGNNLTLTSGTNIRNKFASTYDGGKMFSFLTWSMDVGKAVAKKLAQMGLSLLDLSILRSIVEVFWRPQEGALTVKSNRFLKLEAGGASAGYPDAAYKDPKNPPKKYYIPYLNDTTLDNTLNMTKGMVKIIQRVDSVVDRMIKEYRDLHADYINKLDLYTEACKELQKYSNDRTDDASPCKTAEELKDVVWEENKDNVTEENLGFKETVKADDNGDVTAEEAIIAGVAVGFKGRFTRGRHGLVFNKKSGEDAKAFIIKKRKELRSDVLEAANNVLESIKKLKNVSFENGTWTSGMGYFFGAFTGHMPAADYIKSIAKALSKENLQDTHFYIYDEDEDGNVTDTRRDKDFTDIMFEKDLVKRRAILSIVEDWGAKPQPILYKVNANKFEKILGDPPLAVAPNRPETNEEFMGKQYELYVYSLEFPKLIKMETGLGLSVVKEMIDKFKFWAPVHEYKSWGNAKDGKILFGTGDSYVLDSSSGILQPISTVRSTDVLTPTDAEDGNNRYNTLIKEVKMAMLNNQWENVQHEVEAEPVEEVHVEHELEDHPDE